jgi:DNA replication protein
MSPDRANNPGTVPVPDWFLEQAVRQIREIEELQVMLAYFRLSMDAHSGEPMLESALFSDPALNEALKLEAAPRNPVERIERGIELAVARDSLLRFTVSGEDTSERVAWLMVSSPENRVRLERYRSGVLAPPGMGDRNDANVRVEPVRPGVFQLYEQNIGLVTPIIADRLVEALELYPESWIEDAIAAAVSYNRRNWRYIQRILETWATEGRNHETDRRHQPNSTAFDPERHLRGEYAAVFRRQRRE